MRISDDRYSRDRLRLDLALRFIHHEARTHTIRAWTGLTDDRIRKLYRTYLHEAGGASVARHRGKSPRQAAFFTRSMRMRREAAVFASVSSLFGLITPQSITVDCSAQHAPTVARGALLCEAFETYCALIGESQISFEHAVFLLSALLAGDELRVAHCRDCTGVLVTDRLALRIPVCNECSGGRHQHEAG
jgi:Flagellar transcriptional activator (FlhC)